MKYLALLTLLAGLLVFVGCANDDIIGPPTPMAEAEEFPMPEGEGETEFSKSQEITGDIVDTAIDKGFTTLVAAVQAAELVDALRDEGPFTVFAPTDEAFAKLPEGLVAQLLLEENKPKLQQLLLYHVVAGEVTSRDLRFFQRVETLEGSNLNIFRWWRLIKVNSARVTLADVLASNGVIHVINEVLIPEGFTLEDPVEPELDIVDTAIDAGFDTLVAAVGAASLVDALRGEGPLTVFAPTEEAFAALDPSLLAALLLPENKATLQELLLYHVTAGAIQSKDLRRFQFVKMLNDGYTIVTKNRRGTVRVNWNKVVAADVLASNGVIHAIDEVLIPLSFYGSMPGLPNEAPKNHPELEMMASGAVD